MMLAVDDGVGRIVDTLRETGRLNNTLIIFTSDNGYFYGEHGLTVERRLPYEESVGTPLLMRLPKLVAPGTSINGLAAGSVSMRTRRSSMTWTKIPTNSTTWRKIRICPL